MQYFGCKITVHPASFNCLTAMSDFPFNSGIIFAAVAVSGKSGQLIFPFWVDTIVLPLGIVTRTGFLSSLISVNGACGVTKCPVAPESNIPKLGLLDDILLAAASSGLGVGVE